MSQRFNFYDIYGYLIPGLTFVTLLWLPFGIINPALVNPSLTAAAALVVVGYIVGQAIVALSGGLMVGKVLRTKDGTSEQPSVVLLNRSDTQIERSLKELIACNVRKRFRLDVRIDEDLSDDPQIRDDRQAAFFLCRVIVNKLTGYAEQFQGLYSMSSGLTIVFALGFFYLIGWVAAYYLRSPIGISVAYPIAWVLLIATVVLAARVALASTARRPNIGAPNSRPQPEEPKSRARSNDVDAAATPSRRAQKGKPRLRSLQTRTAGIASLLFGLLLTCCAYLLGTRIAIPCDRVAAFPAIAALCLAASFRFYSQYRHFATEFAKAVWKYFPAAADTSAIGTPSTD